eukprot:3804325-Pyramimonas_sp.AAC.1
MGSGDSAASPTRRRCIVDVGGASATAAWRKSRAHRGASLMHRRCGAIRRPRPIPRPSTP